ncbi:uncharacterized protein LOC123506890 isoform X2 [Portunus trituberculatus]|uniref:uncharacterized protein LOC123506890 isoform X2 n=1 Tax=Portunus trituberculatus TaxID=210409 RepID=UPI001E1D1B97|nr:uncharacterized protein LOC123506890 isoform X2 [Portunus trituberculatus]
MKLLYQKQEWMGPEESSGAQIRILVVVTTYSKGGQALEVKKHRHPSVEPDVTTAVLIVPAGTGTSHAAPSCMRFRLLRERKGRERWLAGTEANRVTDGGSVGLLVWHAPYSCVVLIHGGQPLPHHASG